jgi:hypothetical protein
MDCSSSRLEVSVSTVQDDCKGQSTCVGTQLHSGVRLLCACGLAHSPACYSQPRVYVRPQNLIPAEFCTPVVSLFAIDDHIDTLHS